MYLHSYFIIQWLWYNNFMLYYYQVRVTGHLLFPDTNMYFEDILITFSNVGNIFWLWFSLPQVFSNSPHLPFHLNQYSFFVNNFYMISSVINFFERRKNVYQLLFVMKEQQSKHLFIHLVSPECGQQVISWSLPSIMLYCWVVDNFPFILPSSIQ